MLILTRKLDEKIMVGDDICIKVTGIAGNQVSLGIEAPKSIPVHREEIHNRIEKESVLTRVFYKKRPLRVEHRKAKDTQQNYWH